MSHFHSRASFAFLMTILPGIPFLPAAALSPAAAPPVGFAFAAGIKSIFALPDAAVAAATSE